MYMHERRTRMSGRDKIIAENCMATRARMAARAISRDYDEALRPVALKVTQLTVLVGVSLSRGALTMTELADSLGMERSGLSRNLDPLERRGLVAIGPETQHRARYVELTDAGRDLIDEATPLWEQAQAKWRTKLGQGFETTMASLKALGSSL